MNAEETRLLQDFLKQLTAVRGVSKDPQADALIRDAVSRQPDAAYLLVQRTMILEQALEQAKTEIARLSPPAAAPGGGFLDAHSLGRGSSDKASDQPLAGRTPATGSPAAAGAAWRNTPATAANLAGNARGAGGMGGSFLGTMAATAAGVAGGAFLFHGIGSLLGNDSGRDAAAEPTAEAPSSPEADGTQDLASANDGGSLFDDPSGGDVGGDDFSLL